MPRHAKPARLWLQPERRNKSGQIIERAVWVIRCGRTKKSTGCGEGDRRGAEEALEVWLTTRRKVRSLGSRDPARIYVGDVLKLYADEVAPKHAGADKTLARIETLSDHLGQHTLAEINGATCRAYVEKRGSPAAARRELEDLRAAINHHRREGLCSEVVGIWLPEKPVARDRWLTRSEAARLIWAAWRYREIQKGQPTDKRPRRHVAKFILVGLYTGTRSGAIVAAALEPAEGRGFIDLDRGVFYRRAAGGRITKKRQPPVRLPSKLLAHMRRWRRNGQASVVEWRGGSVSSVRKAFAAAAAEAGLDAVTPHTLRHTAATWLMQAGVDAWEAAGYLGMTVDTLLAVYGHHHPDWQESARAAFDKPRQFPDRNARTDKERSAAKQSEVVDFAKSA